MPDGNVGRELDRADAELDLLISRRETYLNNEAANARTEEWIASERRYRAERFKELADAWSAYYLRQAEIHERLADENRERAAQLFAGAARGR